MVGRSNGRNFCALARTIHRGTDNSRAWRVANVHRRIACLHGLVRVGRACAANRDFQFLLRAGAALAPPLLTWLMLSFGWRTMFFIAGAAGFVIAILWTRFYRAPQSPGIPASDLAEIRRKDSANVEHVGFQQALWLLRFPTTWACFSGSLASSIFPGSMPHGCRPIWKTLGIKASRALDSGLRFR